MQIVAPFELHKTYGIRGTPYRCVRIYTYGRGPLAGVQLVYLRSGKRELRLTRYADGCVYRVTRSD